MTATLTRRRRRPRPVLVDVTNYWRCDYADGVHRREVVVRDPDGTKRSAYVPDEHPALVRFLQRTAA